jgi:hypothetical protein
MPSCNSCSTSGSSSRRRRNTGMAVGCSRVAVAQVAVRVESAQP